MEVMQPIQRRQDRAGGDRLWCCMGCGVIVQRTLGIVDSTGGRAIVGHDPDGNLVDVRAQCPICLRMGGTLSPYRPDRDGVVVQPYRGVDQ